MASAIAREMTAFRRELDAQAAPALKDLARNYRTIITTTEAKARALATQIEAARAAGREVSLGQLYRIERYEMLLVELQKSTERYALRVAAPRIEGLQSDSAWLAQEHAARTERVLLGDELAGRFETRFVMIPEGAIENLSGVMRDGGELATYLRETLSKANVESVRKALAEGLGTGLNPREVGRIAAKASGVGLQRSTLIARTEMLRTYRESQRERWASTGVVQAYRRTAAVNERTCLGCIAMDGTIFQMHEELNDHPGGRCTAIPVFVVNGEVLMPPMQTAQSWLAEQPDATQVEVMGPARWAAWKRGDVEINQMAQYRPNERFGGAWVPRNVSDIVEGGEGGELAAQIHRRTAEQMIA